MDRHAGITLLELLTALALVAVLAGLAVPALDGVLLNARRAATMDGLARAAWFARTEALKRGRPVILCASGGGARCVADTAAWTGGWRIAPADDLDFTLREGAGSDDRRARLVANRSSFRFEPHDRRSTNGTVAWCDRRGLAAARAMVVAPTGRPRLERGAGSLDCPAS
jgi:type IV fimbrial biogenesis protein FimT